MHYSPKSSRRLVLLLLNVARSNSTNRSSGSDSHLRPSSPSNPVVVGHRDGDGVAPGLLGQGNELPEHQLPGRARQIVDIGGGETGGGDGIENCRRKSVAEIKPGREEAMAYLCTEPAQR